MFFILFMIAVLVAGTFEFRSRLRALDIVEQSDREAQEFKYASRR